MGVGGRQGPHAAQRSSKAELAPVLPHLDHSFTVPCDEDPVIFIGGHGTHNNTPIRVNIHRELPQQTSIPVDGPGIDEAIDAAAQHGSCVLQTRPGLQKNDLHKRVGLAQQWLLLHITHDLNKPLHPTSAPIS